MIDLYLTEDASVARVEQAREILWKCGYGIARDGEYLFVYDPDPGATFASVFADFPKVGLRGYPRFKHDDINALWVPGRRRGPWPPVETDPEADPPLYKCVARIYCDEGNFNDMLGEPCSCRATLAWEEVIDATELFRLICRRIDPTRSAPMSLAMGRGRAKSEENAYYFKLMCEHADFLAAFELHLFRRDHSDRRFMHSRNSLPVAPAEADWMPTPDCARPRPAPPLNGPLPLLEQSSVPLPLPLPLPDPSGEATPFSSVPSVSSVSNPPDPSPDRDLLEDL